MSEENIPVGHSNKKYSFWSKLRTTLATHLTAKNLLILILIIVIISFIVSVILVLWYPERHMYFMINGKEIITNPFLKILAGTIILPVGMIVGFFGMMVGFAMMALGIALAIMLLILGTSPLWAPIILLLLLIKKLVKK